MQCSNQYVIIENKKCILVVKYQKNLWQREKDMHEKPEDNNLELSDLIIIFNVELALSYDFW